MTKEVEDKLRSIISETVEIAGYELVETKLSFSSRGSQVRIFIDKVGGVTVDDCARVSKMVERRLDELDIIESRYNLEVSSPGVERPLREKADYLRYMGKKIKVHTREKTEGSRKLVGLLRKLENESIRLEIDEKQVTIPLDQIHSAKLYFEFKL